MTKRIFAIAALGGVLLTATLAVALLAGAFDSGSDEVSTSSAPEQAADGGDGDLSEGIQVHGDWVIEVRNADGSVAERREFQNALQGGGQALLAQSLGRTASPGVWMVVLGGIGGVSPCPGGPEPQCVIREPISSIVDGYPGTHFPTLTVTGDQFGPFDTVLEGNFDAPEDGPINTVETINCFNMPPDVDPAGCDNSYLVTQTTLPSPVNVLAGQQVLVTVTITFS